jgi:DNA-directed RNA polymerase specialized sigma subunit
VPRQQIIDVFRSLRTNYGRPPTQAELAANLSPRIEVRTLQEHLSDYGLPWPIE